MDFQDLCRCLNRRGETVGDGFQPEDGDSGPSGKKKHRPPKRIGQYRLMKPKRRTASLKETDADVLEATRKLMLSDSTAYAKTKFL